MTPSLRAVAVATLVVAACATFLIALAGGGSSPAVGAERVTAAQAATADFSVLRRPRTEHDRPSPAVVAATHGDATAAGRSRRAELPLGSPDVRVLPREDDVCLLVETAGGGGFAAYGCALWSDARAGRLHVTLSGGPDQAAGDALVVGLVPDDTASIEVEHERGTDRLALSEGFYTARVQAPRALAIHGARGLERIDLGDLPGHGE